METLLGRTPLGLRSVLLNMRLKYNRIGTEIKCPLRSSVLLRRFDCVFFLDSSNVSTECERRYTSKDLCGDLVIWGEAVSEVHGQTIPVGLP